MKLYGYYRSSATYRVRISLHLKSIPFEAIPVDLVQSEQTSVDFLRLNPQGLVPALKLDDGRVITQSGAILEWLEFEYPITPLRSANHFKAAQIRALCDLIACDIHPLNNLRVTQFLQSDLGVSDEDKLRWYHHWIQTGFTALEAQLGAGPYSFGEAASLADVYLVPQVYNALRFKLDMSAFPKISNIYAHCNQQSAFIAAHPDHQVDKPS